MSLEQSIATLTAAVTALMALPQTITDLAVAKINAITAAYNGRIASLKVVRYVNGITGSDTANSGAVETSPYRTIQKAITDCPRGASLTVVLQSDITLAAHVEYDGIELRIQSDGEPVKRTITPTRYVDTGPDNVQRRCLYTFRPSNGGQLVLRYLALVMPAVTGYESYAVNGRNCMFVHNVFSETTVNSVTFLSCDLAIPSSPFGSIFHGSAAWIINAGTLTATDQAIAGRFIDTYTNTSGTATNTCPDLLTNLATV